MQTVVGVFDTAAEAERAREQLVSEGFSASDVRVQSHPDSIGTSAMASDNANTNSSSTGDGFMSGISNFFSELFGSDDEHTGNYSEAVRRGGTVLAVSVSDDSKVDAARAALADAGAVDIDKRAESWREKGYSSYDPTAQPYKAEEIQAERGTVLPVVREELEVGKRQVDLGAVRVFSRTESRPVSETVQLREERADIDRRSVDRPATAADMKAFDGGSIEVREMAERAVVKKSARVVEEVVVGKQANTRTETINDTVRNTVVEVEKDGDNRNQTAGNKAQPQGMSAYRTHFNDNLASAGGRYEEYEPAYAYGSTLRSDARYAGRSWDEVESDAQQDWTSKNPGGTWARMKDAVRHGWESMTSAERTDGLGSASRASVGAPSSVSGRSAGI